MHSKVLLLSLLSPVAFGIPFWHYVNDNEIDTITASISATPVSTPCATPTPTPIYGFPETEGEATPVPTFATPTGYPVFGSPTPTPSPGGYEEPSYPELDDTNAIYYHFDDAAGISFYGYCEPNTPICPPGAEGCPFICGAPQDTYDFSEYKKA